MSNLGYGFNILTERAQPNLAPAFETGDDAAQARVEVAKCTHPFPEAAYRRWHATEASGRSRVRRRP
jgi:hypothetical protein